MFKRIVPSLRLDITDILMYGMYMFTATLSSVSFISSGNGKGTTIWHHRYSVIIIIKSSFVSFTTKSALSNSQPTVSRMVGS